MLSECKALRVFTSLDDHVVPVGTHGGRQAVKLATEVGTAAETHTQGRAEESTRDPSGGQVVLS